VLCNYSVVQLRRLLVFVLGVRQESVQIGLDEVGHWWREGAGVGRFKNRRLFVLVTHVPCEQVQIKCRIERRY